jgi:hypothetical protein
MAETTPVHFGCLFVAETGDGLALVSSSAEQTYKKLDGSSRSLEQKLRRQRRTFATRRIQRARSTGPLIEKRPTGAARTLCRFRALFETVVSRTRAGSDRNPYLHTTFLAEAIPAVPTPKTCSSRRRAASFAPSTPRAARATSPEHSTFAKWRATEHSSSGKTERLRHLP